jgi:hypothetical protein
MASPATPLSRVLKTGGFASPPYDGFALAKQASSGDVFPGVSDSTESVLSRNAVKRVAARIAKCLDAATCGSGYKRNQRHVAS